MKHYCHYHPITPAKWHCPSCQLYFGNACVPGCDERQRIAECPVCSKSMSYFKDSPVKAPFWQEISRLLGTPLQPGLFLTSVVISLLALIIPVAMNGYLVSAVLGMVASMLSVSTMLAMSKKPYEVASVKSFFESNDTSIVAQASFVTTLLGVFCFYCFDVLGGLLGGIIFLLCLFILPCWLLALGRVKNLRESFSIALLLAPLSQMGSAYLGMVAHFIFVIVAALVLEDMAAQHFHDAAYWPVSTFALIYVAVCMGAILGHILAEYRLFESDEPKTARAVKAKMSNDTLQVDAAMDMAIKDGDYDKALKILEEDLKKNNQSEYRRMQFLKLVLVMNDMARLERHVHGFLNLLVSRNQVGLIEEIIEKVRAYNSQFRFGDLALSLKLARLFQKKKNYEMVLWLAEEAHTRFDMHEDIAEIYLLASKVSITNLKRVGPSKSYLQFIVTNFEDIPAVEAAKILLSHIDKYSARSDNKKA